MVRLLLRDMALLAAHRPYQGVLDVIQWFQIQPDKSVALNTGRPEHLRAQTLQSLNALGGEYRVEFSSELLPSACTPSRRSGRHPSH